MDHYVFSTESEAVACLEFINSAPWLPLTGKIKGRKAPETKQQTKSWAIVPVKLITGEWAIRRLPSKVLDYAGVPDNERSDFLSAFKPEVRELKASDLLQDESLQDESQLQP